MAELQIDGSSERRGSSRDPHARPRNSLDFDLTRSDIAVIALHGAQSLFTASRLAGTIATAIRERRHVVVDLTEASLADSAAVGVLIAGRRHCLERALGFALVLRASEHVIPKLLESMGGPNLFPISQSQAGAMTAARSMARAAEGEDGLPWLQLASRHGDAPAAQPLELQADGDMAEIIRDLRRLGSGDASSPN
jgi:anti-anti-sigma regulatory factor